jgi:hypothetical protein
VRQRRLTIGNAPAQTKAATLAGGRLLTWIKQMEARCCSAVEAQQPPFFSFLGAEAAGLAAAAEAAGLAAAGAEAAGLAEGVCASAGAAAVAA